MKLQTSISLFFIAACQVTQGHAQTTADGVNLPTPVDTYTYANSSGDFSGVRMAYPVQVYATVLDTSETVCIPANFPLRGLGLLTANGLHVKLRPESPADPVFDPNDFRDCDSDLPSKIDKLRPIKSVIGKPLLVKQTDNTLYTPRSNGLTYGMLIVPFKYYVNGSRDFKGAGTIGPYAGWKLQSSRLAAGLELVGFAGLSAVSAEKIVDGKPTSETLAAFGYGVAAIGRIRNNFQVGVVLGQDRVGKSSQYKDNGKWWLALSIGFPFSN